MVKIRKEYKQPDGTIIEVEGTEEEIEKYERKQKKKQEGAEKNKRVLYGKMTRAAARALKDRQNLDELKKFITEEMMKLQAVREIHHWYFNNGWWWRPWWFNGNVTYIYSQTSPSANFSGPVDTFNVTNDAGRLNEIIGVNVGSLLTSATNNVYASSYSISNAITAPQATTTTVSCASGWSYDAQKINNSVDSDLSAIFNMKGDGTVQ
jgi:hypothetical protein